VTAFPIEFLKSGLSGSGVYGSIFLSSLVAVFYLRRHSQNLWQILDVITPSLALIIGLGRMGCFASGCCFGKPTESMLGLVFAFNSPAGLLFPGQHLIPTQLFAASTAFVLVTVTLLVDRKKGFYGLTFCLMMVVYGLGRFVIDFFRFYESQMVLFSIGSYAVPTTQMLSLLLSLSGVGLGLYLKNRV